MESEDYDMRAIKIDVVVPESRELRVTLPAEVPAGKAQLIVLSPNQPASTNVAEILRRGREWRDRHPELLRSKRDIDQTIEEDRASWGNDE